MVKKTEISETHIRNLHKACGSKRKPDDNFIILVMCGYSTGIISINPILLFHADMFS